MIITVKDTILIHVYTVNELQFKMGTWFTNFNI